MHFDTPDVVAGGSFRVFGRNLSAPDCAPQVVLVCGANRFNAQVNSNCYSILSATTPSNIPLGEYSVLVWSGLGSFSQAVRCPETIAVRPAGPDTFRIGVPWSADLKFGTNIYNVLTVSLA